jgi:hypothetical protein
VVQQQFMKYELKSEIYVSRINDQGAKVIQ